eukprot:180868-Rhodomonas_salina.1
MGDLEEAEKAYAAGTTLPRYQVQETAFSVQFVPAMRFLIFDFAVSPDISSQTLLAVLTLLGLRAGAGARERPAPDLSLPRLRRRGCRRREPRSVEGEKNKAKTKKEGGGKKSTKERKWMKA